MGSTEPNQAVDDPLIQTEILYQKLRSMPMVWEQLCGAALAGRPGCLSKIVGIATEAGIIDADQHSNEENCMNAFTIFSEHHESVGQMKLSQEEFQVLTTIIWALEAKTINP
jgi:hypothetical protein